MQSINAKNIGIKEDLKMVAKMEKEFFFIKLKTLKLKGTGQMTR